ncbi:hypothetical protein NDU88_002354, partial [Pleurodeles waltl]
GCFLCVCQCVVWCLCLYNLPCLLRRMHVSLSVCFGWFRKGGIWTGKRKLEGVRKTRGEWLLSVWRP